jgi:hypothetical protein
MLNISILYSAYRFFYQAFNFLKHWYIDSFYGVIARLRAVFHRLDRTIALGITLRHIFEPLYQDYTFIGYILGFIFRSTRALFGIFVYGLIAVIAIGGFGIWCAIPLAIAYGLLTAL